MSSAPSAVDSAVAGTDGLPRRNGELVFDAPWEARAFGLAIVVCREQGLDWEAFRSRLIDEIGDWEREPRSADAEWSYYARWLAALERLLADHELVAPAELSERADRLAHEAAHEHDEHDGHDHHHHHH